MLAAARAGTRDGILPPDRRRGVERFVVDRLTADGGFANRRSSSDLYYTLFGIECLLALGREVPASVTGYLQGFGAGEGLDLVHLACLARCRADLGADGIDAQTRGGLLAGVERCRSADGGYGPVPGADRGSVYSCFLALGACQDLGADLPAPDGVLAWVASAATGDGGYANRPVVPVAMTAPTSAAVVLTRQLGAEAQQASADWLLARRDPGGGFRAGEVVSAPDLLSTAVALHALAALGADVGGARTACTRFVGGLWSDAGGFCAQPGDLTPDCEYTYYGLLALGHLVA